MRKIGGVPRIFRADSDCPSTKKLVKVLHPTFDSTEEEFHREDESHVHDCDAQIGLEKTQVERGLHLGRTHDVGQADGKAQGRAFDDADEVVADGRHGDDKGRTTGTAGVDTGIYGIGIKLCNIIFDNILFEWDFIWQS